MKKFITSWNIQGLNIGCFVKASCHDEALKITRKICERDHPEDYHDGRTTFQAVPYSRKLAIEMHLIFEDWADPDFYFLKENILYREGYDFVDRECPKKCGGYLGVHRIDSHLACSDCEWTDKA